MTAPAAPVGGSVRAPVAAPAGAPSATPPPGRHPAREDVAARAHDALGSRLAAVAPALSPAETAGRDGGSSPGAASRLLPGLVEAVRADPSAARCWLLLTALAGAYPTAPAVQAARRFFRLHDATDCALWALRAALPGHGAGAARALRRIELVQGAVIVDVDHTAKHDLHTGIQQVIRSVAPRWQAAHQPVLAAWTSEAGGLRPLLSAERRRVLAWSQDSTRPAEPDAGARLLVPWQSTLIALDVPDLRCLDRLRALAAYSGTTVVGVGYDCIPAVSPGLVPWGGAGRFAQYLSVVKHMQRVAAISPQAAAEFTGFVLSLGAQGLPGPAVVTCPLPRRTVATTSAPVIGGAPEPTGPAGPARPARPLVLSVGSIEPRKNHLTLLAAAERLWRDGLAFDLLLIGGMAWSDPVADRVRALQARGRPLELRLRVSDAELASAYRAATCTVFASLHEGYGLPIVESLSYGTPVITSRIGAPAWIAESGGALVVDPHDPEALAAAVRRVVSEPGTAAELQRQAAHRDSTDTWDCYAARLWSVLTAVEVPAAGLPAEAAAVAAADSR